ncbi:MAG: tRNA (N(6)-L-threonylcarbamoyladenosine(37)-C(2))-methylthiotransferase MtaB [Clostridia bacterium]|jgi:threonylcarbamoyladenosine tRNA methylthiotransferase MtaB
MKSYSIVTLGCKVNQYESSVISAILESMNYLYKKFPDTCDIYVVNTCTVTSMSDKKSRQMIHKAKILNPDCIIIATGCLAQQDPDILVKNGADIVLGNYEKNYIEEILTDLLKENKPKLVSVSDISKQAEYIKNRFPDKWERTRGYLKIQDGCDNFCSYCIIPYVRGRVRSRDIEDIVKEAEHMASRGIKEVVLTGIHLDSYGKGIANLSLINVIARLNEIKGLRRIRLGSLEPNVITDSFVSEIKKYTKLCPHFHMSLQSGSDKVLKDMNRRYDSSMFINAVKKLRNDISNVEITTDIIVGYPTETDEDFQKSIDMVNDAMFIKTHVFKFSKRIGTAAENLKPLNNSTLSERSEKLIAFSSEISKKRLYEYIGTSMQILIEEDEDNFIKGHTVNYIMVTAKKNERDEKSECINTFCDISITGVSKDGLEGIILS